MSDQFTSILKGCMHMFDIVDTSFIDRLLITSGIFQGKGKYSACDLIQILRFYFVEQTCHELPDCNMH